MSYNKNKLQLATIRKIPDQLKKINQSFYLSYLDRKLRKMYRGCGKAGICDEYDRKDENSIQLKVLECTECYGHYCNAATKLNSLKTSLAVFIFTIVRYFSFNK